jgi:hypothetical protein
MPKVISAICGLITAIMNIKSIFGLALILCVAGCSSMKTSTLTCTLLSHEERDITYSDLNSMLVNNGFEASTASETAWGTAWSNAKSLSPLWNGRADFQISWITNSYGMDIDVLYYKGGARANKSLVEAIVACVQSNAPSAKVKVDVKTEYAPFWAFKE